MKTVSRILVPVDGSAGSQHAVRFAAELAAGLKGTVVLTHVVHLTSADTMGLAHGDKEDVQRRIQAHAAPHFAHAKKEIADIYGEIDIEEVVHLGDPVQEILGLVRSKQIDLIVMGSRGLTPFEGYMLGSVSDKIVRHAGCPVTVVR